MLTVLEKLFVLKSVAIFGALPDDLLLEVAAILHEEQRAAGELVFAKGDLGTSMYIVARGRLHAHDGPRTLNELPTRAVFGEMAMLDPEPRSASVTALEESLLLRIDNRPFYELMADRGEVALAIIQLLASYLRERLDDIRALDARRRNASSTDDTDFRPIAGPLD